MKNGNLLECSDPFRCHKKKIVSGVHILPRHVFDVCQRYDIDVAEDDPVCVNCLKKLQSDHQPKYSSDDHQIKHLDDHRPEYLDPVEQPVREMVVDPTPEVDYVEEDSFLVCYDPFKAHRKLIMSGVCKLPRNVFVDCRRRGISIDEDATVCINCIKKLQMQTPSKDVAEELVPEPASVKPVFEMRVCCNPFKTHKKTITNGLFKLPEKLHRECQSQGIDVGADAHICVNCMKKMQNQSRDSNGIGGDEKRESSSVEGGSPKEGDLNITKEYLHKSRPSLGVGKVELDGLSPATQISKIISSFNDVKPARKRKLTSEAFADTLSNGEQHKKYVVSDDSELSRKMNSVSGDDSAKVNGNVASGKRGALIVLEGCDRTGKTTQSKKLIESLEAAGKPATLVRFPDRTTKIGSIIDSYLSCSSELEDHSIHLLFSANRWELLPKIKSTLYSGTSVIVDRYAFSGVAFSAAKKGLSLEWCKKSDVGLPKPDLVLFLDLTSEEAARRAQFGNERYEKADFQRRVYRNYTLLQDESWRVVNANKSIDDLQDVLLAESVSVIDSVGDTKLGKLWV